MVNSKSPSINQGLLADNEILVPLGSEFELLAGKQKVKIN
jgi:hypothetical protein